MNLVEVKTTPDPDLIRVLEELLEEARSGEVQCITYVITEKDGLTTNGWAGMKGSYCAVIGELEILKADLVNQLRDE